MWIVVVGGFLINFSFGICNASGNIAPYVISYTRQRSLDPHREVVTLSYAPWLLATGQATQSMAMFLGGVMVNRIGVRFTVFIGCLIASGGMLLSAGAVTLSFWVVVITYGALGGLGRGIAQNATLAAAVRWDPQHKGLAMGILLAGYAMTPIIFIPIQTTFVNYGNLIPNYYPDGVSGFGYFSQSAVLDMIPYLFVFMGGILLLIQMIGNAVMVEKRNIPKMVGPKSCKTVMKYLWASFKPEAPSCCIYSRNDKGTDGEMVVYNSDQVQESNENEVMTEHQYVVKNKPSPPEEVPPRSFLKRWDFYFLWFAYMILGGSYTYHTSIYKAFGEEFIFDDQFLATVGTLGSVGALIFKITFGILADHIDSKTTLVVSVSIAVVSMFNIYSCSLLSVGGSAAFAVCYFLIDGGLGGMRAVVPVCIAEWYGHKSFAVNYGILYTSNVPASILAMAFSPVLHPYIGWEGELLLVASLSFIGLTMIIIAGDRKRKKST